MLLRAFHIGFLTGPKPVILYKVTRTYPKTKIPERKKSTVKQKRIRRIRLPGQHAAGLITCADDSLGGRSR